MKTLLEAGVHFGHQTRRWDPRMRRFIFTERNGIHILDLQQTVTKLQDAYNFARDITASGGKFLFVGTKKQAQEAIQQEAERCGQYYVNHRWPGGMLTNFQTIQHRIDYLVRLEDRKVKGEFDYMTKKEQTRIEDELDKLQRMLGGVREMTELPQALFIIDPHKEQIAVLEALRLEIPIVALVDTNCNPDQVDYPVPANDDAIRAVKLLAGKIADACLEGLKSGQDSDEEMDDEYPVYDKDADGDDD
jgi:small subunit ribosomal protein S2